jgi:hypothetical protein
MRENRLLFCCEFPGLGSLIVSQFPLLFAEFWRKAVPLDLTRRPRRLRLATFVPIAHAT